MANTIFLEEIAADVGSIQIPPFAASVTEGKS